MDTDLSTAELPTEPQSKAELIERVRSARAALDRTVERLSEAQMTAPGPDGWSIKDILAHIAAWEQILLVFHIGGKPFQEAARLAAVDYQTDSIDSINEALHRRDKARSLPETLDASRSSYGQVLAALEGMSEADLFKPYTPAGRESADGGLLINWIAGDTYEHYSEHEAMIQTRL
jgi:uncharacterized protein (TIGR03083 family)